MTQFGKRWQLKPKFWKTTWIFICVCSPLIHTCGCARYSTELKNKCYISHLQSKYRNVVFQLCIETYRKTLRISWKNLVSSRRSEHGLSQTHAK